MHLKTLREKLTDQGAVALIFSVTASFFAKLMSIIGKVNRMDSLIIESDIRKLSQMKLIYTCIS